MLNPSGKFLRAGLENGLSKKQIEIAKAQGDSYFAAVKEMLQTVGHGESRSVGNFMVAYAVCNAEGFYKYNNGVLNWYEPRDVNTHIEVMIADSDDGRFIPGLEVAVTIADKNGNGLGTEKHPFVWHPWLYHYGKNWKLPGDGVYDLRILIEPPQFIRRDKHYGNKYIESMAVNFPSVEIQTHNP